MEAREAQNADRGGRMSGVMAIFLIALLVAGSIVFGITWQQLLKRDQLSQEDVDALWTTYNDLVAQFGEIPLDCECEGVNITFPVKFSDEEFALFDNTEPSRILVFDLEPLSAGVDPPQPIFVQNTNGTVAYVSDIPVFPTIFTDDEFAVFSKNDANTRIVFNASGIFPGTPVILTIQDSDGVVALLEDVVDPTDATKFPQNQFEIAHVGDTSKKFQFDVDSLLTLGSTTTLVVPDMSGTIAYLSDLTRSQVFPDNVFMIFSGGDAEKKLWFDASNAVSGIQTEMTIQDASGTMAYRDQLVEFFDVHITESRPFPSPLPQYEGFSTLEDMGVTQIMIWMCGGGGNGRMNRDSDGFLEGGGGGGGGGFRELTLIAPADRFASFSIGIGAGGEGSTSTPCVYGGTTSITGIPANVTDQEPWELLGYGGACGGFPRTDSITNANPPAEYGGCGAGSGGKPEGNRVPGEAGDFGGVPGVCGRRNSPSKKRKRVDTRLTTYPSNEGPQLAVFRHPWQGGTHGASYGDAERGYAQCTSNTGSESCPAGFLLDGGSPGRGRFGGAAGMFGNGGDTYPEFGLSPHADPNTCAGGGARLDTPLNGESFGNGGSGRVVIRYWSI